MVASRQTAVLALLTLLAAAPARADSTAQLISDSLIPVAVASSAGLWALGGDAEVETGRRCTDGLLATGAFTAGLKSLVNQPRPDDPQATDGFPSGHAALAFCAAAIVADREPGVSGAAYLWAGAVGWSRVKLRRHDLTQVLAGAALGYLIGRESVGGSGVFGDWIVPESDAAFMFTSRASSHRPGGLQLLSVSW